MHAASGLRFGPDGVASFDAMLNRNFMAAHDLPRA
jgi:hypothetical protein